MPIAYLLAFPRNKSEGGAAVLADLPGFLENESIFQDDCPAPRGYLYGATPEEAVKYVAPPAGRAVKTSRRGQMEG